MVNGNVPTQGEMFQQGQTVKHRKQNLLKNKGINTNQNKGTITWKKQINRLENNIKKGKPRREQKTTVNQK